MFRLASSILRTTPRVTKPSSLGGVRTIINIHEADNGDYHMAEESEGNVHDLNWSLCGNDVVPYNSAYGNLSPKRLLDFVNGQTLVGEQIALKEVDVDASFDEFESLYEEITDSISRSEQIFVHDGAVGSFKDDRTHVRIISDSPLLAQCGSNLLVRVPIRDRDIIRPIVVYVATKGDVAQKGPTGFLNVEDKEFYDEHGDHVYNSAVSVFAGSPSVESIQQAIVLGKQRLIENAEDDAPGKTSLILPCDVTVVGDKTSLIFGASDASRVKGIKDSMLYGAHYNLWGASGLTSMFAGAVVPSTSEDIPNKETALVAGDKIAVSVPANNLVEHPSAAVFVKKGESSKEITAQQAGDLFQSLKNATEEEKLNFVGKLEAQGTKCYVVDKESDITSYIA